jgi:hypothetical protein
MENIYGKDGQVYCDITKSGKSYVYAHLNKLGEVYYIGSGKKNRCNQITTRTAYWKQEYANNGMKVIFIAANLSKEDAYALEKSLIKKIQPKSNIQFGGQAGIDSGARKEVYCYGLDGSFKMKFYSMSDAYEHFGGAGHDSKISMCLSGKRKSYKGHMFKGVYSDKIEPYKKPKPYNIRKVYRYDLNGNFIGELEKIAEFKEGSRTGICNVLDKNYTCFNSFWRSEYSEKIQVSTLTPALKEKRKVIDIKSGFIYDSVSMAASALNMRSAALSKKLKYKRFKNLNVRYLNEQD